MHIKKGTIHIGQNWKPQEITANKYSISFDGVDDAVKFTNTGSFSQQASFTFSFWIKASYGDFTDGNNYPFFAKGGAPSEGSDAEHNYTYLGTKRSGTNGLISVAYEHGSGTAVSAYTSYLDIHDGEWHHIVITRNTSDNNIDIYVDDDSKSITDGTGGNDPSGGGGSSAIVRFGVNMADNRYFPGKINDVAVWNTPLDSAAITELYNSKSTINLKRNYGNYDEYTDNLTFWLRGGDGFVYGVSEAQEKDGVLLYDQSGAMNGESNATGSFVGAPSFVTDTPSS